MLKKIKAAVLAGMLAFGASMSVSMPTSFAMISESGCDIGGVYVGMSRAELINRYGEPDSIDGGDINRYYYFDYDLVVGVPSDFFVQRGVRDAVTDVDVRLGSNLVTADGFGIGDSIWDVRNAYGDPDDTEVLSDGAKWFIWYGSRSSLHFLTYDLEGLTISEIRLMDIRSRSR